MASGNEPLDWEPLSQNPWLEVVVCLPVNDQVTVVPCPTFSVEGEKLVPDAVTDVPPPTALGAPTSAANSRADAPRPTGARSDRMRTPSP
jgi:hypothetical protein